MPFAGFLDYNDFAVRWPERGLRGEGFSGLELYDFLKKLIVEEPDRVWRMKEKLEKVASCWFDFDRSFGEGCSPYAGVLRLLARKLAGGARGREEDHVAAVVGDRVVGGGNEMNEGAVNREDESVSTVEQATPPKLRPYLLELGDQIEQIGAESSSPSGDFPAPALSAQSRALSLLSLVEEGGHNQTVRVDDYHAEEVISHVANRLTRGTWPTADGFVKRVEICAGVYFPEGLAKAYQSFVRQKNVGMEVDVVRCSGGVGSGPGPDTSGPRLSSGQADDSAGAIEEL